MKVEGKSVDLDRYLPTPFAARWEDVLQRAMNERGWWCVYAESQLGKTTCNVRFRARHPAVKGDGSTSVPVALTCASRTEGLLLAGLADSLGGARLMRMPQRTLHVARALERAGTRLVIVQNAHFMDWRQWEQMLVLEEMYKALHIEPAFVFSSIHPQVGLISARSADGSMDQLRRRLRFEQVRGHDRQEVRRLLQMFCKRDDHRLIDRGALDESSLVHELLTTGLFLTPDRTVATVDAEELVNRMSALLDTDPRMPVTDVIRSAHAHLVRSRTLRRAGVAA